jgi:hypothetical protein
MNEKYDIDWDHKLHHIVRLVNVIHNVVKTLGKHMEDGKRHITSIDDKPPK